MIRIKVHCLLKLFFNPFDSLLKADIGEYLKMQKTAKTGTVLLLSLTLIIILSLNSCKDSLGLDNYKETKIPISIDTVSPNKNKYIKPDSVILKAFIGHGSIYNMSDTSEVPTSPIDVNIRIDATTYSSTLWFNTFNYKIFDDPLRKDYETITQFFLRLDSVKCIGPIFHDDNDKVLSLVSINFLSKNYDLSGKNSDFQLQFDLDNVSEKTHGRIHGRFKTAIPSVYQPNNYIFFFGEIYIHYTYSL